jgi:hypothetical protein
MSLIYVDFIIFHRKQKNPDKKKKKKLTLYEEFSTTSSILEPNEQIVDLESKWGRTRLEDALYRRSKATI